MRGRWILLIVAANLAGIVALACIYPNLMVSAGPLVPAHAALATDCFACHAPLRGASAARCMECHALPTIGLRTTAGLPVVRNQSRPPFHQALLAQDCMACHSDHPGSRLARGRSISFSHALLRPAAQQDCATCHTPPATPQHAPPVANCAQCHSQVAWTPASFDHDRRFVLDRNHNASCTTCHVANDTSRYTCFGCHEHQESQLRSRHQREGIRDFENCVACHRSAEGEHGGREGGGGRERGGGRDHD
jgi:hypothetical protein